MPGQDSLHGVGVINASIQRATMLVVIDADYKSYTHDITPYVSKTIDKVFDGIPRPHNSVNAFNSGSIIGVGPDA